MSQATRLSVTLAATVVAVLAVSGLAVQAQKDMPPTNDAPNPYQTVSDYFKLPAGRTWGSTSAVDIDKDGKSIWVAERCGVNSCNDPATGKMSPLDPILKFDENGKLLRSFGAGMIVFAHGIWVDRDGNIWVTDGQGNMPVPGRGARGRGANANAPPPPPPPTPAKPIGHQVWKFSPEGKVLLTLGTAGVPGTTPTTFNAPSDVITNANGDIFVADGHGGETNARIVKFDKNGKFVKTWGKKGSAPGEFDIPHSLAFDSRGRLFVADRNNLRLQIFDQDGNFIDQWYQFSRISGIFIDKNDLLYAADSESSPTSHPGGWRRGMRIGSAKDGKVQSFIPDPEHTDPKTGAPGGTSAAEGVAVDAKGNVYGAEVGPKAVKKYVKK
jgi:sugar lactone lactonase YvrE